YEALSYEWGDPQKECIILLTNESHISITRSLYNALRDLRDQKLPRLLWADGICIHQDDIEERQKQVSIMGVIYSKAYRVLTCTGPERDSSTIAIDFAYELLRK
ncbi:heterokaryon incompatibility, partial [Leptodontidium sp. 2 PMI_412]